SFEVHDFVTDEDKKRAIYVAQEIGRHDIAQKLLYSLREKITECHGSGIKFFNYSDPVKQLPIAGEPVPREWVIKKKLAHFLSHVHRESQVLVIPYSGEKPPDSTSDDGSSENDELDSISEEGHEAVNRESKATSHDETHARHAMFLKVHEFEVFN